MTAGTITFTTDFGSRDGYTGIVKGVILSVSKTAQIVDLSHEVESFNTQSASWIIYNAYNYFPAETVHLVVVDPGVGSSRRGVIIHINNQINTQINSHDKDQNKNQIINYFFVGPDNGIFSLLLQDPLDKHISSSQISVYELPLESRFYAPIVSSTFHARDIYGKVAAHLSLGVQASELGFEIETSSLICHPLAITTGGNRIKGNVAHIDHFGNLISNVPAFKCGDDAICFLDGKEIGGIQTTYQSVPKGELVTLRGSHGFIEVARCEGRADAAHGGGRSAAGGLGSSVEIVSPQNLSK